MQRTALWVILVPPVLLFLLVLLLTLFTPTAGAAAPELTITPSPAVVKAGEVFTVTNHINIWPEENLTLGVEFPLSEEVEFVDADPGFVYVPADPAVPYSFNSVKGTITGEATVSYRLRLLPNTLKKAVLLYARIFYQGKVIAAQYEAVLADFQRRYLAMVLR